MFSLVCPSWELDSLLDPINKSGLAVRLSGRRVRLVEVVTTKGPLFAEIWIFGTRGVVARLGGRVDGSDPCVSDSADPGLEGSLGVPGLLDGICRCAGEVVFSAPLVVLIEVPKTPFESKLTWATRVAWVKRDTGGGDLITGTIGVCEAGGLTALRSSITSLYEGGDVLHLLGDNGLGEAAFKPEIERLTAVPFLTLDATTFLELANSRCVPLGGSDILPFGICSLDRVLWFDLIL